MSRDRLRSLAAWGAVALVLAFVNTAIIGKERVIAGGTVMLLDLAPVDPRSLMQGDYMQLDYAVSRSLRAARPSLEPRITTPGAPGDPENATGLPRDGHIVVRVGSDSVAAFERVAKPGERLGRDEHLLRYRYRDQDVRVGPAAFFFQEGQAERFARARYGDLRVDASGDAVLVGLRDQNRQPL